MSLGAMLAAACGSRTAFRVTPADDGSVVVTDKPCSTAGECLDVFSCTLDVCDPVAHVCVHTLQDAICDDGVWCNGEERCDVKAGCVGSSRDCNDGIACTADSCDEGKKQCAHAPDDMACPISQACDVNLGCQARAFAHDDATLYDVRIPSGEVKEIGPLGIALTDVALHPSNVLYGVASGSLTIVDQKTGRASFLPDLSSGGAYNAADVAPDGTLYIAGGASLDMVDPATGKVTSVMEFPSGLYSSGDLAFLGGRLLATANGPGSDQLVEFDLAAKRAKSLGSVGFSCVWGLAAYGTTLYGLTCKGEVIEIDTGTGQGRALAKARVGFWGASAR
jgi:hypothetical protein